MNKICTRYRRKKLTALQYSNIQIFEFALGGKSELALKATQEICSLQRIRVISTPLPICFSCCVYLIGHLFSKCLSEDWNTEHNAYCRSEPVMCEATCYTESIAKLRTPSYYRSFQTIKSVAPNPLAQVKQSKQTNAFEGIKDFLRPRIGRTKLDSAWSWFN